MEFEKLFLNGFTMNLFIGNLAFSDAALIDETKKTVLSGSILSALFGAFILIVGKARKQDVIFFR